VNFIDRRTIIAARLNRQADFWERPGISVGPSSKMRPNGRWSPPRARPEAVQ